jgi:hypothetical protein
MTGKNHFRGPPSRSTFFDLLFVLPFTGADRLTIPFFSAAFFGAAFFAVVFTARFAEDFFESMAVVERFDFFVAMVNGFRI